MGIHCRGRSGVTNDNQTASVLSGRKLVGNGVALRTMTRQWPMNRRERVWFVLAVWSRHLHVHLCVRLVAMNRLVC